MMNSVAPARARTHILVARNRCLFSCFAAARAACVSTWLGELCGRLTGDARPRFFESKLDELCSRSGGDAREAMTVGCKLDGRRASTILRICPDQGPSRAPRAATEYLAAKQPRAQRA